MSYTVSLVFYCNEQWQENTFIGRCCFYIHFSISRYITLILNLYSVYYVKKFMKCNSCTPISVMKADDLEPFTKSHVCAKHVRVCNGAYYM